MLAPYFTDKVRIVLFCWQSPPSVAQTQVPVKQINAEQIETAEQFPERLQQLLTKTRQSLNSA